MSNAHPAGWYPDGHGAQRWWDGTQWTQSTQSPYQVGGQAPYQAGGALSAPSGTDPSTVQIWAIVALFALQMIAGLVYLGTFDWNGYMAATMATTYSSSYDSALIASVFTPAYAAVILSGLLAYWLTVLLAYFDTKVLRDRGVERPFHWAFSFIPSYGSMVYVIGRSVVAKRRTGSGSAPMWAYIAIFVVGFVLSIVATFASMSSIMNEIGNYSTY